MKSQICGEYRGDWLTLLREDARDFPIINLDEEDARRVKSLVDAYLTKCENQKIPDRLATALGDATIGRASFTVTGGTFTAKDGQFYIEAPDGVGGIVFDDPKTTARILLDAAFRAGLVVKAADQA